MSNIVAFHRVYNEIQQGHPAKYGEPISNMPSTPSDQDAGERGPYRIYNFTWNFKIFAHVLASFTGRFAGVEEWSASKERLAYIFGNITASLGFQFPEKCFSPDQSARIIKMTLDMILKTLVFMEPSP